MDRPVVDSRSQAEQLDHTQTQNAHEHDQQGVERLTSSDKGTLYFAYGSNLSTTQMQQRCPSSAKPLAIVKLNSHSWFICDRGYANVIAVRPLSNNSNSIRDRNNVDTEASTVWGLLYLLTSEDETRLDRNEGWHEEISGGPNPNVHERRWKPFLQGDCSYNKLYLLVEVEKWLVDDSQRARFDLSSLRKSDVDTPGATQQQQQQQQQSSRFTDKLIRTLIYVDEVRTRLGRINTEYIPRMSRAVKESVPLGIPETWVERTMRQHGIVWFNGDAAGKRSRPGRDYLGRGNDEESWQSFRENALVTSLLEAHTQRGYDDVKGRTGLI